MGHTSIVSLQAACHCKVVVLQVLLNSLEDSIMLCEYDVAHKAWIIRFVNQPWIRLTGEFAVRPSLQCSGCCFCSMLVLQYTG